MTTQTITTNNNCNNNNNNKDIPNQGLFPVESSDEMDRSAGAAGGRQELRFTVHSVYCTNTALCSKVHCAQTIVHCAQPPQTIVHCEQALMVMFDILILILDTSRR